ncbi:Golgi SNAP receptor complex member 1-like isoform X4 [Watersipora subatra]|uniref:Golgi SNAP receptor complex member 1-like isoform X4 n=1 Tax=Watersipora subatra TaxID=2589382 RepID=UPI00355B8B84
MVVQPAIRYCHLAIMKISWDSTRYLNMATEWEDLRKQARQLENDIDLKLISFSKFGTSYSDHRDSAMSDTSPLLSNDHMFETMVVELEELLARLSRSNDKMMDYTQNLGMNSGSAALLHTMQRHREILQDYTNEFRKTKANIQQHRQREDLLGGVRREMEGNRKGDLYLKENEHLRNSERLIDEQINIAMATKENLSAQRGTFTQITKRMQEMSKRFPLINNLMTKVNLRKKRDTVILGTVISACVIFLLWWVIR